MRSACYWQYHYITPYSAMSNANKHCTPIGLNIILRNKNETQVLCEVHIDSPLTLPLNGCREIIFWGFFVNENREKDVTLNL